MSKPKILVVDDKQANLLSIQALLSVVNAELHLVESGNKALEMVLENDYALILLDVQMPDMDGFEVATYLNGFEKSKNIPIIFITAGIHNQENLVKGYKIGAVDYIEKPINETILLAKVNILLKIWSKNEQLILALTELTTKSAELKIAFEEQKQFATRDPLTNLFNRRYLQDRIKQELADHLRQETQLAYLSIDLDKFKFVNDSLGHDMGDLLLKEVAKILSNGRREADTVARVGGDEFILLLGHVNESDVASICEKLLHRLSKPIKINGHTIEIGASIGIVMFPKDANSAERLEKNADISLFLAKDSGRGRYSFYDSKTNEKEERRQKLIEHLKKQVHKDEFYMLFQPRVNLETNAIVGFEALMRWESKEFGFVSPVEFIPLLESINLISEVTFIMLERSLHQFSQWLKLNNKLELSFNFSPLQIQEPGLTQTLLDLLDKYSIPPSNFELEITEGLFLNDREQVYQCLNDLRAAKCKISMDDFGTGYSSLSYIKRLPIDTLKIDQSFVRDILIDNDDKKLTEAIIRIAKIFNFKIVAEGVEEQAQKDLLLAMNCHFYQGYLFSKPVGPKQITKMLTQE